MRIAWERIASLGVTIGVWVAILAGGRHVVHLLGEEVHALARLTIGGGRLA